jgi:hypothetical protein
MWTIPVPDTLLALARRDDLSGILTRFHRAGYGHVIKVMDPKRAPLSDQLRRAGVPGAAIADRSNTDDVLLFVPAPERTMQAAAIAHAAGATDLELVEAGTPRVSRIPSDLRHDAGRSRHRPHRQPDQSPSPATSD